MKLSDADYQKAADDTNLFMKRVQGGEVTPTSQKFNESMRKDRMATECAAIVFIRTLQGLSPNCMTEINKDRKFWDVCKKHFPQICSQIETTQNPSWLLSDTDASKVIEKSIADKTLIAQIDSFIKAIEEQNFDYRKEQINLLKLAAEEPYTISMREIAADTKKKEHQIKLANSEYKNDSGPIKKWHLSIVLDLIVAGIQIGRKGFAQGILDPLTLSFGVGSFLPVFFPNQVEKVKKMIVNTIKKLSGN